MVSPISEAMRGQRAIVASKAKSHAVSVLPSLASPSTCPGANVDHTPGMVQLTVRLVAVPERVDDIVRTLLKVVMLPAQQLPGCRFAQVYQRVDDHQRVDYVEEWDELAGLRQELSSERFSRLLELVEMAAEAPEVEFRSISETHGIDYVAEQRAQQELGDVEPGDVEPGGH